MDPTKPEEKIFFANSTVTVELPTEYQDFTDRMFHKRMEEVTVRPLTRCSAATEGKRWQSRPRRADAGD